jgi:hypothetical protein
MEEQIPLLAVKTAGSSIATRLHTSSGLPAKTKNQLGTINGCFVPCCLTIMSAGLSADETLSSHPQFFFFV